jgi:hypothetical protein
MRSPVFSSLEDFNKTMQLAESESAFDKLIIVGSPGDIRWVHASLPTSVVRRVAAEIEYPLLSTWFRQPMPMQGLTQALEGVFKH